MYDAIGAPPSASRQGETSRVKKIHPPKIFVDRNMGVPKQGRFASKGGGFIKKVVGIIFYRFHMAVSEEQLPKFCIVNLVVLVGMASIQIPLDADHWNAKVIF